MRNSPLAIRLCYCSQDINLELPDLVLRTKLLAQNSVVPARVYQRVIRGFFAIICGIPLSHFTGRRTNVDRLLSNTQTGYVGAFGRLKAAFSVTELQTGGSLHLYGQRFGMIDQRVLTRWIHDKAFRQEVCDFVDAIVTTEIPEGVLSMSKQLPISAFVSQPYPSAVDVPVDSALCRL